MLRTNEELEREQSALQDEIQQASFTRTEEENLVVSISLPRR
jgi:hypothetical protein